MRMKIERWELRYQEAYYLYIKRLFFTFILHSTTSFGWVWAVDRIYNIVDQCQLLYIDLRFFFFLGNQ